MGDFGNRRDCGAVGDNAGKPRLAETPQISPQAPGWARQEEPQPGGNRLERRQSTVHLRELRAASPTPTRKNSLVWRGPREESYASQ
jgi:hypothetical protein